jgi:hypothetical protein
MLIAGLVCLLFVSVCLACFLFFLIRRDLSPSIAFAKIQNRLKNHPSTLLPVFADAPYRMLSKEPPRHRPTLVNLQTSEGTGQACHPDVTYIAQGFGPAGWRYWMVCTPYAYGNFVQENPEIFASHDGIHWTIPDGVNNPLISSPQGTWDHNSDPDMFFLHGKLWLYYRETRPISEPPENRIYLTSSVDGVAWTSPAEVLVARGEQALLMSPAVIHHNRAFRMWTVEKQKDRFHLVWRESTDGLKWSAPLQCTMIGLAERQPWHLDVIREEDRLSALLVSLTRIGDWRLHYAYSTDDGNTWNVAPFLFEPAYEFEAGFQYRATLLKIGSNPHTYQIWYSAANRREMFSIAYQTVVRENGTLKPVIDSADQDHRRPLART